MNTQIVKTYDIKQIGEFIPNYKFCKIEDLNGKILLSWNQPAKKISEHWKDCVKRLNSAPIPEGFYNIFCCNSLKSLKHADVFIVKKGDPQPEESQNLKDHQNFMQIPNSKNDLISVSQALNYITEIANLKVTVQTQEAEIKRLKDEITVLEAELSELDREALSDPAPGTESNVVSYLKETAPTLMALADRYFSQQDKKLEIEKLKAEKTARPKLVKKIVINKKPTYETGSPEHIQFIENLADQGNEEALNDELDKLQTYNPELYANTLNKLNLSEEDEN